MLRYGFKDLDKAPKWDEVRKFWRKCEKAYEDRKMRLSTLLVIGFTILGLRPSEVADIRYEDVDLGERIFRVRQRKKRRKAEPYREMVIPDWLYDYLETYLTSRKFEPDEKIFTITRYQVWFLVVSWTEKLLGRRIEPRLFRHAFGIRVYITTKDLETTRKVLGHASYQWIKAYIDYTIRDVRKDLSKALRL